MIFKGFKYTNKEKLNDMWERYEKDSDLKSRISSLERELGYVWIPEEWEHAKITKAKKKK